MFRWFALLLALAVKSDMALRIITVIGAGAVLAFGVWVISNVALTIDALKNPYIAGVYAVVLLCFLVVVGTIVWLRLWRLTSPRKFRSANPAPTEPLPAEIVSKRAEAIAKQWESGKRRRNLWAKGRASAPLPPTPDHGQNPKPSPWASLLVTGPAYAGKTSLIAVLTQATSGNSTDASEIVRFVEAAPIDSEERQLTELIARVPAADGVLFVVDQDLRAPEVAAIKRLMATAKPLYIVLNKADQFNAADRDAILQSIRVKMPETFAKAHVVSVAAAPRPVEREIEDARGRLRIEFRQPASDIRALTDLLSRVFPLPAGRALRFEAEC